MEKDKNGQNEVISAQQAEELKLKEKRRREREVRFLSNLKITGFLLFIYVNSVSLC